MRLVDYTQAQRTYWDDKIKSGQKSGSMQLVSVMSMQNNRCS